MRSQEFFASYVMPWMGNNQDLSTADWQRNCNERTLASLLGGMVNGELPPRERISEIQIVAVRHALGDVAKKADLESNYVALIPIATYINSWR